MLTLAGVVTAIAAGPVLAQNAVPPAEQPAPGYPTQPGPTTPAPAPGTEAPGSPTDPRSPVERAPEAPNDADEKDRQPDAAPPPPSLSVP
jgi:hypothetical protein